MEINEIIQQFSRRPRKELEDIVEKEDLESGGKLAQCAIKKLIAD